MNNLITDLEYKAFLADMKQQYRNAQLKAAYAVNAQMIDFYWSLGKRIIEKQNSTKWGGGFLEQISKDMQSEFPGSKGFSVSNLERMRKFAKIYPEPISAQAVRKLPWGHIVTLIEQIAATLASVFKPSPCHHSHVRFAL